MRRVLLLLPLAVLLVLAGCAGGPSGRDIVKVEGDREYVIVDHKTMDFGGKVPQWITRTTSELENNDYPDHYVFLVDQVGKDLQGIELWAKNFSAASDIARMVETRVEDKFVGAAAGDMDGLEGYMEQVVKSTSNARYSGVRTEDSFWIKKRYNEDETEEYRYVFLITVPREQIDAAIQRAFDETEKPKTEEKQTAVNRVKDAFKSDGM